jgi:hypothetical protein
MKKFVFVLLAAVVGSVSVTAMLTMRNREATEAPAAPVRASSGRSSAGTRTAGAVVPAAPGAAIPAAPANAGGGITEASVRQGLVLHFTFDKDEPTVPDTSGNNNNGAVKGAHWTSSGKKGGAYEFRADRECISVPNAPSLNPSMFTLAAWIKGTYTDGSWRRIIDKSYDTGFALGLGGDYNNRSWRGLASFEMAGRNAMYSTGVVMDGQWHLLAVTYDGQEERLYVDGTANARLRGRAGGLPATTYPVTIGSNYSTPAEEQGISFRGLIDEPMLFNRVLSPAEIMFLFNPEYRAPGANLP